MGDGPSLSRPRTPTRASPGSLPLPRPDRSHRVRPFRLGAGRRCACSGWGGERRGLESYSAIHQGTIFGATLITGAIWAKASGGVWWSWGSNQLVLFLVLFLFYCAYFMLRFSIEEGARRERISAVYALFGVALIPVSFLAIRLASDFIHPTVFTRDGPQMTDTMFAAFLCLLGCDLAPRVRHVPGGALRQAHRSNSASSGSARVSQSSTWPRLRRCARLRPRLGVIIAMKLARLERETAALGGTARERRQMAELLVWPALIAYGEAAFAYAGELRGPGRRRGSASGGAHRLARPDGAARRRHSTVTDFHGRRWAGALNLFVAARRRRVPDLGLQAPLSPARARGDAARGGAPRRRLGRRRNGRRRHATRPGACSSCTWADARRVRRADTAAGHGGALPVGGGQARSGATRSCACAATTRLARPPVGADEFRSPDAPVGRHRGRLTSSSGETLTLRWPSPWHLGAARVGARLRREAGLRGRRFAWLLLTGFALIAVVLPLAHFAS